MIKKLALGSLLLALTACGGNYENYYLNDYVTRQDLQSLPTTEIALENIIYARLLNSDEAEAQFGPDANKYSIVFLEVKNIADDASFFNFENALISNDETGKVESQVKLAELLSKQEPVNLEDRKSYMNPFRKTDMEDNNLIYNLNQKILSDFALQPNSTNKGFLIFEKLRDPSELQFTLSAGVSIYTTRIQTIKLDTSN